MIPLSLLSSDKLHKAGMQEKIVGMSIFVCLFVCLYLSVFTTDVHNYVA